MTEVVAALIWNGDRVLACQRPAHKDRALLWEFVGGKVEPGETGPQALVRECREELGITVTGFDDALYGTSVSRMDLAGAAGFHLVLAHEPDLVDMLDTSLFDLMLSGHTHGGQVDLPFVDAIYLPRMGRHYIRGLFRPGGDGSRAQLYVNRGIGESLLPVRFCALPEVTVLTLTKE